MENMHENTSENPEYLWEASMMSAPISQKEST
jgi:hypothetical protein